MEDAHGEARADGANGADAQTFENFYRRNMEQTTGNQTQDLVNEPMANITTNVDPSMLVNTVNTLLQQNAQMLEMLKLQESGPRRNEAVSTVVPDFPSFNGEKGTIAARQWLEHLETSATIHNWGDSLIYQMVVSNMTGAAKHWVQSRLSYVKSWPQLKAAFIKSFMFENSKTELWQRMQARVQQARESVTFYFFEKVHLCNELGFSFQETKKQVAIGLWSRDLSNFILSKVHLEEDELYQDIVEYESVETARRNRARERRDEGKPRETGRAYGGTKKPENKEAPSSVASPPSNQVTRGEVRCYNCGQVGHLTSRCSHPLRARGSCYQCGSTEHLRKDCPQRATRAREENKQESTSAVILVEVPPVQPLPEAYRVLLYFSEFNMCQNAILDTGSPISFIVEQALPEAFIPLCISSDVVVQGLIIQSWESRDILLRI